MNISFIRALIVLAVAALGPPGILGGVYVARADDVPDALSVRGKARNLARNFLTTRTSAWPGARSHRGLCTSVTHTRLS